MANLKNQKKLLLLKQKLSADWKNVFRSLINAYDLKGEGVVTAKSFEEAMHKGGVFLGRDDLNILYR